MSRSRHALASVALIAIAGAIANVALYTPQAVAANATVVEAESMKVSPTSAGSIASDSTASSGKDLVLRSAGTASITTTLPAASSVTVRAKGQNCNGYPIMNVMVDGKTAATGTVSANSWTDYPVPTAISAGSHTIGVAFTNQKRLLFCTRNLAIDSVTVVPSAPATTTPTTTTTPTSTTNTSTPTTTTTTTPTVNPTGVPGNWAMKFDNEFSGTALDLSQWSNCWFNPTCGTMNNVATSPSNVSVSNGNLVLTLASSSSGALVSTNPNGGATVGYQYGVGVMEARVYFPGDGTNCYNWPALWTTGQSWPTTGENDIAEVLAGKMTVNYHSGSGDKNMGAIPGYWCGAYHTYTLNRQATKSDVYYDGTLVRSYATDDQSSPQYLIVNVGSGQNSPAVYGAASQVKVDYVRTWQSA